MKRLIALTLCLAGTLPFAVQAQQAGSTANFGPSMGDREFSLSGSGSSSRKFDNTNFGISGDLGWYLRDHMIAGVRQSINYADLEGESLIDDYWNGATRGYLNFQTTDGRLRPFGGGSLGFIYGDGIKNRSYGQVWCMSDRWFRRRSGR
ncbi:hypothetical protein D893_02378 [Thioalkalivibrio sp. ALE21]|nr:hypothetical protein D893_02378 [Thioalkalivibrio sp. ALE21]